MNSTYGSMAGSNNPFKNPEGRAMRRMISLENENPRGSYNGPVPRQSSVRNDQETLETPGRSAKKDLILPEIVPNSSIQPLAPTTNTSHNQPPRIGAASGPKFTATGGAGFTSGAVSTPSNGQTPNKTNQEGNGVIRPPLYIPQKREGGRTAGSMLSGTGIQGAS